MSKVILFPSAGRAARDSGESLLDEPPPHRVQYYTGEEHLFDTVAHFLAEGLVLGDGIVVIATRRHRETLEQRLRAQGGDRAIASDRLLLLDARATLAKFMVGGMPDTDLFREFVGRLMIGLKRGPQHPERIRAYGEMVDLLWRDGNSRAAIRLEELWNDAGKEHPFSLLCAYVMGNFYKDTDQARFFEVWRGRGDVLPAGDFSRSDDANAPLTELSLLQRRARARQSEIADRQDLEIALRDAQRERTRAQKKLNEVVRREESARERAEANDAFKETFLGILGQDLLKPLGSVVTTARTMKMRGGLDRRTNAGLERIVSSSSGMRRMIDQLVDLTRARLADGIPVHRTGQELGPLVARVVDQLRTANPARQIVFSMSGPCRARVDADRFEQVVASLLGNAISHGGPAVPIQVELAARPPVISLAVRTGGAFIDPESLSSLFDPFRRAHKPHGRSESLSLELYIAERIVTSHGGKLAVTSSAKNGTRFEVLLPSCD